MIEAYTTKNYFLLIDDNSNQAPHLHDTKQFVILTHHIPSNWQMNSGELAIMTIGPKSWQEPDFWDKCYDGDEVALNTYKHETKIILDDEKDL